MENGSEVLRDAFCFRVKCGERRARAWLPCSFQGGLSDLCSKPNEPGDRGAIRGAIDGSTEFDRTYVQRSCKEPRLEIASAVVPTRESYVKSRKRHRVSRELAKARPRIRSSLACMATCKRSVPCN